MIHVFLPGVNKSGGGGDCRVRRGRQMILELLAVLSWGCYVPQLRNTKQRLSPAHWGDSLPQSAVGIDPSQHVCECVATVFCVRCVCACVQSSQLNKALTLSSGALGRSSAL